MHAYMHGPCMHASQFWVCHRKSPLAMTSELHGKAWLWDVVTVWPKETKNRMLPLSPGRSAIGQNGQLLTTGAGHCDNKQHLYQQHLSDRGSGREHEGGGDGGRFTIGSGLGRGPVLLCHECVSVRWHQWTKQRRRPGDRALEWLWVPLIILGAGRTRAARNIGRGLGLLASSTLL